VNAESAAPIVDLTFAQVWQAAILTARPPILPPRHFVFPVQADEVERGALEILIRPQPEAQPFLATCALGFRDPSVPSGIWSCPNPVEICAVSGGYAYVIDTSEPDRFTMIAFRPVLQVLAAPSQRLLLFVGHHGVLAWGGSGEAWQSGKLSDEGVSITNVETAQLHGCGWNMITDQETPFTLDLRTGARIR
jgi:hypothetical protein